MKKYILLLIVPLLFSCNQKKENLKELNQIETEETNNWSKEGLSDWDEWCESPKHICDCCWDKVKLKYPSFAAFIEAWDADQNDGNPMELWFTDIWENCGGE